jgi:hypothetical protein
MNLMMIATMMSMPSNPQKGLAAVLRVCRRRLIGADYARRPTRKERVAGDGLKEVWRAIREYGGEPTIRVAESQRVSGAFAPCDIVVTPRTAPR